MSWSLVPVIVLIRHISNFSNKEQKKILTKNVPLLMHWWLGRKALWFGLKAESSINLSRRRQNQVFLGKVKKKSGDFKVTHQAPCNVVVSVFLFSGRTCGRRYVLTPSLKIMTTYTAGAWWVKNAGLRQKGGKRNDRKRARRNGRKKSGFNKMCYWGKCSMKVPG